MALTTFNFPDMLGAKTSNIITDFNSATILNIINLLSSEQGEFIYDPFYGLALKRKLFDPNDTVMVNNLIDDIVLQINTFIPQVSINRNDIVIDQTTRGKTYLRLKFMSKVTYEMLSLTVVLLTKGDNTGE